MIGENAYGESTTENTPAVWNSVSKNTFRHSNGSAVGAVVRKQFTGNSSGIKLSAHGTRFGDITSYVCSVCTCA